MKKIIYIGYFDTPLYPCSNTSPAAVTMMDYVSEAILRSGLECRIISPAQGLCDKGAQEQTLSNGCRVLFLPSYKIISKYNLPKRIYIRRKRRTDMYRYFDHNIETGDTVLVYHSPVYMDILQRIKSKKQFRLILQVCEIYADVTGNRSQRIRELEWIEQADGYLFASNLLEQALNKQNKRFAICLGTYRAEKQASFQQFTNEKIHVVYAGTFDPRKGGASAAVGAAAYLPENYHLHILGFGSRTDEENLKRQINEVSKQSRATLSFDGLLKGGAYTRFLQKCQIGLSTQQPDAAFNTTSFPSKILSYMSNGLHVVSIKIDTIVQSAIGQQLTYYEEQTPEAIAQAILRVDTQSENPRRTIQSLDRQFVGALSNLFE